MAAAKVIYAVPGMRWLTNLGMVDVIVYESIAADHPKTAERADRESGA